MGAIAALDEETFMTELNEALKQSLLALIPLEETETIALTAALRRVLAEPVTASMASPPFDNSAVDGYAVRRADLPTPAQGLPISQYLAAGSAPQALQPGTAARILTGAMLPSGADAVIMQEDCEIKHDRLFFPHNVRQHANIRPAGEDIALNASVFSAGQLLQAADLGILAALGHTQVQVYRPLKVALLTTGSELIDPGTPLPPGRIYNSNLPMLHALLEQMGCHVHEIQPIADDLTAIQAALAQAAQLADLVLTTGGVSVGDEDYVKQAVQTIGEIDLWQIAIKPGKPFACGRIGQTPFMGLPGNPVSAFITFALLVAPAIRHLQGRQDVHAAGPWEVIADFDWPKSAPKRREFLRVQLAWGHHGPHAKIHPHQGSGILSSVSWADGLVEVAAGAAFKRGDKIAYWPWTQLLG